MGKLLSKDLKNLTVGLQITADDVSETSGQKRVKGIHPINIDGDKAHRLYCSHV